MSNIISGSGSISGAGHFSVIGASVATVTGGTLFSDSTYYYRAFKTTGSNELIIAGANLAVEMLSVGGGGNGNNGSSGGGGGAGSVDWTSLTLTPGTYNASVGAATQDTSLINTTLATTFFTSYAGGDGGAGVRGASTGGGNGSSVSLAGGAYTYGGAAGHIGHAGGANGPGGTTVRKGGGGGGAGADGSAPSGSTAGAGGIGLATYSDICAIVGIGELSGGSYYLGGGGGGGRGATQNSHGPLGLGHGANCGGGGSGGSSGGRPTSGDSGVIVLKYLKSAVA